MTFRDRKELNKNDASNKSSKDDFTFFILKDDVLKQYGLPKQPCPVRISKLDNVFSNGSVDFPFLADECIAYCSRYPEDLLPDMISLLVRLCYIAGVNVGRSGDDTKAHDYFSTAYNANPRDLQVASNYAMALSKINRLDEALEIYESILSFLEDGKRGFSPQLWTEAVKIHHMKGNLERALELVEISIREAPQYFGDDAKLFAQELRNKIENH